MTMVPARIGRRKVDQRRRRQRRRGEDAAKAHASEEEENGARFSLVESAGRPNKDTLGPADDEQKMADIG